MLPAKIPQLLVNGCTGIAVGMATNIPPHNLKEVCDAAVALIDDKSLETKDLLKYVKGPDFPTGGQITNSKKELREIYETGQGGFTCAASGRPRQEKRGGEQIVVTSIPFGISKATLVEKIADVIIGKKLPLLLDVRDESTDDVRIVLELKAGADPALVMAYLYKHTPLELGFPRQHDLPGSHGEPRDRGAGAPRPEGHPQGVLAVPRGRGHSALPVRAGRAGEAHPHPGRASPRSSTRSTRRSASFASPTARPTRRSS